MQTLGGGSHAAFEELPELDPAKRGYDSNRLTADDAKPAVAERLRANVQRALEGGDGKPAGAVGAAPRLLGEIPKNALRVPFLDAVFPDAVFIYLYRDPGETLGAMIEAWNSGRFVTYPELPDWPGPPWSLLLIPGWRDLRGRDLAEIATEQWVTTTRILLDDLERLAPERWCAADYGGLLAEPQKETERLCKFLGLGWHAGLAAAVTRVRQAQALAEAGDGGDHAAALEPVLPRTEELAQRAREWLATPPERPKRPGAPEVESPLRSVYTGSFPELLRQLSSSLIVTTYQTGKLICVRHDRGMINTHFRDFQRPMGLAVHGDRIAMGTRSEVLDYRNVPDVAPKLDPPGSHDACFVPRNRHFTGDVAIHEVAFAEGRLWIVATSFSCLATLDAHHSFIPRWTPRFITKLAAEDRCHLNGLAVVGDRIRFVTALGETDTPGGWRENKARGGCLIDVESSETIVSGISMPHSPRWHRDRLWVLQSGEGELCAVDLDAGRIETVAQLPGYTRGLVFAGELAFVGLSQVRETATFGGIPLMERLDERLCGIWVVNVETGATVAFLRFEDLVQEVFDLALLPGLRYPEIAEEGSDAALFSFTLPEAAVR